MHSTTEEDKGGRQRKEEDGENFIVALYKPYLHPFLPTYHMPYLFFLISYTQILAFGFSLFIITSTLLIRL